MDPNHKHIEGLPLSVVSPVDLGRLLRELETLSIQLRDMQLRTPGQPVKMPKTSLMMDEILGLNRLNLLLDEDRKTLLQLLKTIRTRAPRVHISFSADPSPLFIGKLMHWLRTEIHPVLLLTIGLQPSIGAGCVVRTTNKYFDMSLAQDFSKKRDLLMSKIREIPVNGKPAAPAPSAAPTPVRPQLQAVPVAAAPVEAPISIGQGVAA